ncbi:hypothetical protein GNF10_17785 [Nostoc sp. UCD121]|uniref:hypothetical protein n=1 Tax=Nostoc sp. UCD121 TaxID=2681305 RepID=UPI001626A732|nr:hypothetical protein [Nostoc sp. UCD121]MBC1221247.1 hypothetical protein [Nostoc sp. UCD120]MBC1277758.1 hypothetical protein [Nostoc sp. UCD121]MBC1294289.1 hypothetical protein [Nostoc sp. UCD122]
MNPVQTLVNGDKRWMNPVQTLVNGDKRWMNPVQTLVNGDIKVDESGSNTRQRR